MDFDLSKTDGFDWDKWNLGHIEKHGVNYRECEEVFFNKPLIVNEDETHSQTEERFRVYGQTNKKRLLLMIFTIRNNGQSSTMYKIRVISARDQNKKERREYEKTTTNTKI